MLILAMINVAAVAWAVPAKGDPFSLEQALAGLPGPGALFAKVETSEGTIVIELFEDRAPNTVANFVGLARGLRKFKDAKTGEWVTRPFYDGLTFHRRVPKFMIQGGCPRGDGRGGPGYIFDDELHPELRHDQPEAHSFAGYRPARACLHLDRERPAFADHRGCKTGAQLG